MKKILIIAIVAVLVLFGVIFACGWSAKDKESQMPFKGPTGVPFVKGPSGPPPGQQF